MTVVPGHKDLRLNLSYQESNVIDTQKFACDILEKHNLVMVLNWLSLGSSRAFLTESPNIQNM